VLFYLTVILIIQLFSYPLNSVITLSDFHYYLVRERGGGREGERERELLFPNKMTVIIT
jgi:hypothetical protein